MQKVHNDTIAVKFEKAITNKDGSFEKWIQYSDKLLRLNFRGSSGRHYEAKDIVMEIMLKTIDGTRNWDMERVPSINAYMFMQIRNAVWNLRKREKSMVYLESTARDAENSEIIENINIIPLEEIEHDYDMKAKVKLCFEELEDDKECSEVLDLMYQGLQNKEIAEALNKTVREIENTKKRIKNKLNKRL